MDFLELIHVIVNADGDIGQQGRFMKLFDRIDSALAKVIDVVSSMEDKGQSTTHIDLVEDVDKTEEVVTEKEDKPKGKSNEKAKRPKKD